MFRIFCFMGLIVSAFGQSWQSYVNDVLIGEGFTDAAILGNDGSVWAISNGFSLEDGDGTTLASLFKNPGDAFGTGIRLAGIKYLTIKSDGESLYGKKGAGGVAIVKTGQTIIIGVYGSNLQPGNAAVMVEKFGDYLKEQGY